MPQRNSEEEALQRQIVEVLRLQARPGVLWWHTPNGGLRSKSEAARFKAMGVRPGVPDLTFVRPGGSTCFMELKAGKGRPTTNQQEFLRAADEADCPTCVASDLGFALATLECWGIIRKSEALS